ncbi:hypothetical protein AVEN_157571-1 [Araneus ventricosus]|uniref:Uncharacterized protein n=1 Tax=Araneus ventricosus TaxID=182803 RepID=A0A4Y2HJX7_ARAVE|nr:hypothetical protein AVEN_157571-1 [Araneus ventricosus]
MAQEQICSATKSPESLADDKKTIPSNELFFLCYKKQNMTPLHQKPESLQTDKKTDTSNELFMFYGRENQIWTLLHQSPKGSYRRQKTIPLK